MIFEHPFIPDDEAVLGPIEGWECYAPDFNTGGVIGPFDPVVVLYECTSMPCIVPPDQRYPFFFDKVGGRGRWIQSGHTLRFIRKKKVG